MADEEDVDTPIDTPMRSDHGDENTSDSGSSSSEEEEEEQKTEWLATSRERRSTAGNRLTTLIQQEAEDDELELLFAEDEDDAGFEDVDDEGSDVQMDSSDDEDDNGPVAGAEDLEGEKELQQAVRAERTAKKRKADDGIPKAFRKKAKVAPTAPNGSPPRPKKKSERASWIPSAEEAPVRASDRRTTKKSKEQLYAQMMDREKRRVKQLENMEKAAKRKEAQKRPEKTQEDRLAEAARIEKKNAKSLNRWEEAEKIREEEQRAKLAALHNRKLEGPVITWWSGMATWVGDKLKKVGKHDVVEEKEKPKKRKASDMEEDSITVVKAAPAPPTVAQLPSAGPQAPVKDDNIMAVPTPAPAAPLLDTAATTPSMLNGSSPLPGFLPTLTAPSPAVAAAVPATTSPAAPADAPASTAISNSTESLPPPPDIPTPTQDSSAPPPPTVPGSPSQPPKLIPSPDEPFRFTAAPAPTAPQPLPNPTIQAPAPQQPSATPEIKPEPQPHQPLQPLLQAPAPPPAQAPSSPPPSPRIATRNSLILTNFSDAALRDKPTQTAVIFRGQRFTRLPKPPPPTPCCITHLPARFRDPKTGLPYANAYAYKEIQRLRKGEYRWSALLGSYVGGVPARGVPTRFSDGTVGGKAVMAAGGPPVVVHVKPAGVAPGGAPA